MKPTYGRVSRYGLVAYASSLDQIGPLTKDVADAALLLGVIAGHAPRDSTSAQVPVPDYAAQHPLVLHFAVVAADARAECQRLEKAGARLFLEEPLPDGSRLIMMRDPWGVPLQLCQRAQPF